MRNMACYIGVYKGFTLRLSDLLVYPIRKSGVTLRRHLLLSQTLLRNILSFSPLTQGILPS